METMLERIKNLEAQVFRDKTNPPAQETPELAERVAALEKELAKTKKKKNPTQVRQVKVTQVKESPEAEVAELKEALDEEITYSEELREALGDIAEKVAEVQDEFLEAEEEEEGEGED
jgi:predicted  nucleic acid-binding Zn-ribbon protein